MIRKWCKRAIKAFIAVFAAFFLYVLFHPTIDDLLYLLIPPSATAVMEEFYTPLGTREGDPDKDTPQAYPLYRHVNVVKSHVIKAIADKNMLYRDDAIFFLGDCRVPEAMPALLAILEDSEESFYTRTAALRSIARLDKEKGMALAETYTELGYEPSFFREGEAPSIYRRAADCRY